MAKRGIGINLKLFLLVILLSAFTLLSSGCKGECKLSSECNDKNTCTRDSCIDKKCVYAQLPDCFIGNSVCDKDKGENECTAPQDCGFCKGENTKYLNYQCIADECVADVDWSKVSEEVSSEVVTEKNGLSIAITYEYPNPFSVDEALFKIKFSLEGSPATVSDIVIKKIQVIEKEKTATRILGDADVNKPLFIDVPAEEGLQLKIPTSGKEREVKPTVKIVYEFMENKKTKKTVTYEKGFSSTIALVDPTTPRECPDCDDSNDCTEDTCSEETGYFCQHTPSRTACCGNFACDTGGDRGENECTCYKDCGYCERDYGVYMHYRCSNRECLPAIKNPDSIKPKTLINDISFGDFQLQIKTTVDEPFSIQDSKIKLEAEARIINTGVQNINCRKLQLVEGNEFLGEANVNIAFSSVGQVSSGALSPDDFLRSAEESRSPILKIECGYDKGAAGSQQHYSKTQSITLGKMTFISTK